MSNPQCFNFQNHQHYFPKGPWSLVLGLALLECLGCTGSMSHVAYTTLALGRCWPSTAFAGRKCTDWEVVRSMFAVVFYQQLNICCILVPNCEDCEVMVFGPWSLVCGLWSSVFGLRSNVDIVSNIDIYIYI